ncbi:MAG: dehydrogenase, partial [Planctomycetes bacterium]|nr:dehydrogenase [Planctomycetota bacterium]
PCGELVLIGVPWKQRTDISCQALLHEVFHKYIHLRSGWEWELPLHQGHFNQARNITDNFAICLRWLAEGRIHIPSGLCATFDPHDCNDVYQGHLENSHTHLCSIFDWRILSPDLEEVL